MDGFVARADDGAVDDIAAGFTAVVGNVAVGEEDGRVEKIAPVAVAAAAAASADIASTTAAPAPDLPSALALAARAAAGDTTPGAGES